MSTDQVMLLVGRARDLAVRLAVEVPLFDYLSALLLLVVALVIGKLVYVIIVGLLELLRFNALAECLGVYELIGRRIRDTPARLAGRLVYWIIFAFFIGAAIDALQIVDVPQLVEGFAGLMGRVFSYALILVLADLFGRFSGHLFDAALRLVDHPAAGRTTRPVHLTVLLATGATNLEVLGVTPRTKAGIAIIGLLLVILSAITITWTVLWMRNRFHERRLRVRFRVGDRITIPDGRFGVVRVIHPDNLIIAVDDETWQIPAPWLLEAPIRREEL